MFAQGGILMLKSLKPAGPIRAGLCCLEHERVSVCLQARYKRRNGHGLGGRTNDRILITRGRRGNNELTMMTGPRLFGFGQQRLRSIPVGKDFELCLTSSREWVSSDSRVVIETVRKFFSQGLEI
jgi:hypothetical protein